MTYWISWSTIFEKLSLQFWWKLSNSHISHTTISKHHQCQNLRVQRLVKLNTRCSHHTSSLRVAHQCEFLAGTWSALLRDSVDHILGTGRYRFRGQHRGILKYIRERRSWRSETITWTAYPRAPEDCATTFLTSGSPTITPNGPGSFVPRAIE